MVKLFRIKEAAGLLGLSESTLYKKTCTREIGFVKLGSRVVFTEEDLEKYIADHRVEAIGGR